jgi:hypothetical protein
MTRREKAIRKALKKARANLKRAKCDLVWLKYREWQNPVELLMQGYMEGRRDAHDRYNIEPKH